MKTIALCLIILIAATNATSLFDKYPINYSPKRSIMTLLTQVEASLKNHGPMDAITRMLNDFVTEVTNEQVQHDNLFAQQQAECAKEFAFREAEVEAAKAAIQEATETLDGCNSQRVRAVQDLAVTKKQLAENRNLLAIVEETRRREAYAFETATEVYQISSSAVDEALVILEEIWAGEASFVQLSRHVNTMFKNAVKIRKAHYLTNVMAALAQMASKDIQGDEALLDRVKNMLTNFREKVETEFQAAVAAENAAVSAYNTEKARLEATIELLTTQRDQLVEEIAALDTCIQTQTGILQSATSKRDRNQNLWDDAVALCNAVAEEYRVATEARSEELELLADIRARVEARFGEISAGVTARGESDEFEQEEWQNNYSYERPSFEGF